MIQEPGCCRIEISQDTTARNVHLADGRSGNVPRDNYKSGGFEPPIATTSQPKLQATTRKKSSTPRNPIGEKFSIRSF
jgi:hypothetical protein